MDLSKLPGLRGSQANPPPGVPAIPAEPMPAQPIEPEPVPRERADYRPAEPVQASHAADAFLSIGLGLLLLVVAPNFIRYLLSLMTGHPMETGWVDPNTGTPIAYRDLDEYWSDLALTLFALVLIADGIVVGLRPRAKLLWITVSLTVLAVVANIAYVILSMSRGYSFPLMSGLAIAFGGYIAFAQFMMLADLARLRRMP